MRRSKLPIFAFSAVFILIFLTQFFLANLDNLKRLFNKQPVTFENELTGLVNIIKTEGPSISYPSNWFWKDYSYAFELKHVCPCKLKKRKKRDLIMVAAQKTMTGAVLFMRSLRRTGYFSPVIIMADGEAMKHTTNATKQYLLSLGAHIVPIGYVQHEQNSVYSTGLVAIYDFMKSNTQHFDRVMVCDLFDIAFQGNPFEFPMENNTLYFVSERIPFKESKINQEWIKNDIGSFPNEWLDKDIVNSGQIIGDIEPMLAFFYRYIQHINLTKNNYHQVTTPDQAVFNILIHSGELDKYQIPYVVCDKKVYSVVLSSPKYDASKGFYNITDNGYYVPMIHQYYVNKELSVQILTEFPREDGNLTYYIKTFPEDELRKISEEIAAKKRKIEEERKRKEEEEWQKAEARLEEKRKKRYYIKLCKMVLNNQTLPEGITFKKGDFYVNGTLLEQPVFETKNPTSKKN